MDGTRIAHYEIRRLLGRGGMGEVYEALDLDLDRPVALKFIAPELAADPEAFRRFEREARAAASLSHPHIATLYAFERNEARPFIAMELMSGESLRDRMRGGPLSPEAALGVARDVALGLAHAHRRGIVHRDIKPENLMFSLDGVIKITDFGLAYATRTARLTMTGTSLGTAAYMAPESLRGTASAPADVFALGVLLHEAVAGALPFAGDSPLALLYTIANEEPIALRAVRADVPEAVEALVRRILAKDPGQRPDAATVAGEIGALLGIVVHEIDEDAAATGDAVPGLAAAATRTEEHQVERVPSVGPVRQGVAPAVRGGRRGLPRWLQVAALVFGLGVGAVWTGWSMWQRADARARREGAIDLTNRGHAALPADPAHRDSLSVALALFQRATARDPRYAEGYLDLGQAHLLLGEAPAAASAFRRVVEMRGISAGNRATAYYGLADVDMAAGAWAGAVSNLERALALHAGSPEAVRDYNNLGYALVMSGRFRTARDTLASASRLFPGTPQLQKNLGLAEFRLGNLAAAGAAVDVALQADPGYAAARGLRARLRAASGDRAGALEDWNAYLALDHDAAEETQIRRELSDRGVLR